MEKISWIFSSVDKRIDRIVNALVMAEPLGDRPSFFQFRLRPSSFILQTTSS